jgi:C-terminal processing protease CtpA/Prc
MSGFVDFKNENPLTGFDCGNKAHRILFLSSFWNIIKYWDVNIYLADEKWEDMLTEMIPEFVEEGKIKFETAKEKLFTKLNDSHSDYEYSYTINEVYTKFPPFNGRIVNDSLVITHLRNKDLAAQNNIALGDVIVSVNGKDFKTFYTNKFSNLISASNLNYLKRGSERFSLLAENADSIKVGIQKKDGTVYNQYINLYTYKPHPYELNAYLNTPVTEKYYNLTDNIGYINLAKITKGELKAAFTKFENSKGIVIDLRNYPGNISHELPKYLYPNKKTYVNIINPVAPGYSVYNYRSWLHKILNPFSAGHNNKKYYKGKVVLLVNRVTGSHAESIAMEVQQAPDCITIGEQTFGAVMNRKRLPLMDNTTIDYTHSGAFYPDGTGVQRNGIKIDVQIKESAKNYNPNLYSEEAIKIIERQ